MENYELYIGNPLQYNPLNGQFLKDHTPFNKGIPMSKWMDGRKIKKVLKCLEIGRVKGNKTLAGHNRIPIVGIKDGKLTGYNSAVETAKILKAKGIKVNRRNICSVCHGKKIKCKFGKYEYNYIRRKAGDYQWFFASDVEKYKDLLLT